MPDDWVEKQFKRRQRARILKSDIKAMRHAIKADGLTAKIAQKERSARVTSAPDPEKESSAMKWFIRKSIVLDQIAALAVPSPIKDEWHKELNSICLTDDTPDALEKLISQVSQYKQTLVFEALCHNPFAEELSRRQPGC
jgi:hypothetical protein